MESASEAILPFPVRKFILELYNATSGFTTIAGSAPLALALKKRNVRQNKPIDFEPSDIDVFTCCTLKQLVNVLHRVSHQFGILFDGIRERDKVNERCFSKVEQQDGDTGDDEENEDEDDDDDSSWLMDTGPYRILRVVNLRPVSDEQQQECKVQVVLLQPKNNSEDAEDLLETTHKLSCCEFSRDVVGHFDIDIVRCYILPYQLLQRRLNVRFF